MLHQFPYNSMQGSAIYKEKFWLGGSFRNRDAIALIWIYFRENLMWDMRMILQQTI